MPMVVVLKMHPLRINDSLLVRDSFAFCVYEGKMSDPIYPEPNIGTLFILQINIIFSLKTTFLCQNACLVGLASCLLKRRMKGIIFNSSAPD